MRVADSRLLRHSPKPNGNTTLGVVLFTSIHASNGLFDPGQPVRSGGLNSKNEVFAG